MNALAFNAHSTAFCDAIGLGLWKAEQSLGTPDYYARAVIYTLSTTTFPYPIAPIGVYG